MIQHISRRLSLALLAFTLFGALGGGMAAASEANREVADPQEAAIFVSRVSDDVLKILADTSLTSNQRSAALQAVLDDGFNMKYIALLTLGPYRRHVTDEDLTAYEGLFSQFMLAKYASLLNSYSGEKLLISGAAPAGKRDAVVRSQIESKDGAPIEAEWRVRMFGGTPQIIDLKVAGLSLAQSQREEFTAVIDRSGFKGLIDILKTTTDTADRA